MSQFNRGKSVTEMEMSYIKEHFHFNADTGLITRDDRANSNGSLDKDGYLILKVKSKQYKAHRIAWFLYYGVFPDKEIDHINRNRTDNRIANLRLATREDNILNSSQKPNDKTGVLGVYIDQATRGLKKKYTTRLKGKTFRFYSLEDAINFRKLNGYDV